jgi:hypothetical protein
MDKVREEIDNYFDKVGLDATIEEDDLIVNCYNIEIDNPVGEQIEIQLYFCDDEKEWVGKIYFYSEEVYSYNKSPTKLLQTLLNKVVDRMNKRIEQYRKLVNELEV